MQATFNIPTIDRSYLTQLYNLSDDVKIDIITMLLQSLKHDTPGIAAKIATNRPDKSIDEWAMEYEKSLTDTQRQAAYNFADTVKKRALDVAMAEEEGRPFGRKAEDFLKELQAETV